MGQTITASATTTSPLGALDTISALVAVSNVTVGRVLTGVTDVHSTLPAIPEHSNLKSALLAMFVMKRSKLMRKQGSRR